MYIIYNQKELLAVLISEYLHKLYIFFLPPPYKIIWSRKQDC